MSDPKIIYKSENVVVIGNEEASLIYRYYNGILISVERGV